MAISTYTTALTDIYVGAGSTTNWSALGGGAAGLNAETDYFIQGTGMTSKNAFASNKRGMILDDSAGQGDMASTIGTDGAVLIWTTHTTPNSLDTLVNGGIDLLVGSGDTDTKHFYVGGSDTIEFLGWIIAAVNPSEPISEANTGTPTAVEDHWGVLFDLPAGGPTKGAPNAIDAIRAGRCDLIYELGTTPDPDASFDLAVADKGDVTDRLGLIQERSGSFFLSGLHQMGDNASDVVNFTDSDKTLFWNDHWKVTKPFNTVEIQNASSTVAMTSISWKALGVNSPGTWVTTQNATVALTTCSFIAWGDLGFDTGTTASACTFNQCGEVDANGATMAGSSIINAKVTPLVDAQDETSYDGSPSTEGTFTAGTGYVVGELITLEDATIVTVDAVSTGAVTQFTVDSAKSRGVPISTALSQVFASLAGTGFDLTPEIDNIVESSALIWNVNSDPNGELDDMTFEMGDASHAIEFGTSIPTSEITLTGCDFTGYSATEDGSGTSETFHFLDTTGTITLNLSGCSGPLGYKTEGVVVTVVNNPVTTKITVEEADGTLIENARVMLETADAGGASAGFPFKDAVTTLTQTAGTATLTASAVHGLSTGDKVVVRGASVQNYNSVVTITVTSTTVFTYAIDSGAGSPAGGTPVFSYVAIQGLTDVNGEISSSRVWPDNQSLSGWGRKSTSSPFFKQTSISIADASGGTDLLLALQPDD